MIPDEMMQLPPKKRYGKLVKILHFIFWCPKKGMTEEYGVRFCHGCGKVRIGSNIPEKLKGRLEKVSRLG